MNIKEAYDLYMDGKKIRHSDWDTNLYLSKDGDIIYPKKITISELLSDGWELYKEHMSEETKEALREVYNNFCREYGHTSGLKEIIKDMGVDL